MTPGPDKSVPTMKVGEVYIRSGPSIYGKDSIKKGDLVIIQEVRFEHAVVIIPRLGTMKLVKLWAFPFYWRKVAEDGGHKPIQAEPEAG
jgi:hypothetical protein